MFFDLHGNVWEWCQDGWRDMPAETQTAIFNPTGPVASDGGLHRVIRDGIFRSDGKVLTVGGQPGGFRVVRTLDP